MFDTPTIIKRKIFFNEFNIPTNETVYFPFVSGLLRAYTEQFKHITDNYEFMPFLFLREPIDKILARYDNPSVACFSSSLWNHQLCLKIAKLVKEAYPKCLIVFGGPQVTLGTELYDKYPFIDVGIFGEGERFFKWLLESHLAGDKIERKTYREEKTVDNLDDFHSPYSLGLFNDLVAEHTDIEFKAIIESNRSCPFSSFSRNNYIALSDKLIVLDEEKYSTVSAIECGQKKHTHYKCLNDDRIVHQGKKECIKINLSNGAFIEITKDHLVKFVDKDAIAEKPADKIEVGDWIPLQVGQNTITEYQKIDPIDMSVYEGKERRSPSKIKQPAILDEDLAWFIGFLIGDGSISKRGVLNAQGENYIRPSLHLAITSNLKEKIAMLSEKLFGLKLCICKAHNTIKMEHGWLYSRILIRFLTENLGIKPLKGKLKVPRKIFKSPKSVVKSFLDGLWTADSYQPISSNSPSYLVTGSKQLAHEVYCLINWIGSASSIHGYVNQGNKSKPGKDKIFYRVSWITESFRDKNRASNIFSSIPVSFGLYRYKGKLMKTTAKNFCVSRSKLKEYEPNHPLLNENIYYCRVTNIENSGEMDVYDVHNHPTHTVAANGVDIRQCDFCFFGQSDLNKKIKHHSLEYLQAEVEWLASNKVKYIFCADANFGMFKRDIEIAKLYAEIKKKHNYPEKFRVCYGKNATDTIYQTAKVLSEADLAKTVTLALQSVSPTVLKNIHRSNIKSSVFIELQKKYTAANIPTYTEIILGLPGETVESFLEGLEFVLQSSNDNQVFIYHCQILPNTPMAKPEYIEKFKIKTIQTPLAEVHGSVRDNHIEREFEQIVIENDSMTTEQWKYCAVLAWTIQLFYSLKAGHKIVKYLHSFYGLKYTEYFKYIVNCDLPEINYFRVIAKGITNGFSRCQYDLKFGPIYYEPEEMAFLFISLNKVDFYKKIFQFTKDFLEKEGRSYDNDKLMALFEEQSQEIPDHNLYSSTEEYATKVVLYGRKSNLNKPIGFQLLDHET